MAAPHTDIPTPCRHTVSLEHFTHITVGPALLLILLLSLLERRRNPKRCRCCWDRPGLLVPVNLLDGDEDRLAYAAAFGSTATNCLSLFGGGYITTTSPMWSQVLLAMVAVTEMGIDFYPFFACLAKTRSLIWSMLGFGYSVIWLLVNLGHVFQCPDSTQWVFKGQPLVLHLPVLTCMFYLVITFLVRVCSNSIHLLRCTSHSKATDETCLFDESKLKQSMMRSYQTEHVSELLKGNRSCIPQVYDPPSGLWGLLRYKGDPTFRFSPRITATFTVAVFCLYQFGLLSFLTVEKAMISLDHQIHDANFSSGFIYTFGGGVYNQLGLLAYVVKMSWYVAFGISSFVVVNYIVRIPLSYKIQMSRLMRGDNSLVPKRCMALSKSKLLAHSMMYSGSQIAYILWGYYVMITAIFVISLVLAYFLILPLLGLVPESFLQIISTILPTFIVSYIIYFTQVYVSKKVLLQSDRFTDSATLKPRRVLALDNRRVYHNVSYFLFFFHILLGLYTCLVRVGKGMMLGVIFLGRIDRSGLVQGYEHWDTGYLSFVSFLQVELCHTHPVLVVFCQLLVSAVRDRRLARLRRLHTGAATYSTFGEEDESRSRRSRSRWFKAYTLIRNPGLRNTTSVTHHDTELLIN